MNHGAVNSPIKPKGNCTVKTPLGTDGGSRIQKPPGLNTTRS